MPSKNVTKKKMKKKKVIKYIHIQDQHTRLYDSRNLTKTPIQDTHQIKVEEEEEEYPPQPLPHLHSAPLASKQNKEREEGIKSSNCRATLRTWAQIYGREKGEGNRLGMDVAPTDSTGSPSNSARPRYPHLTAIPAKNLPRFSICFHSSTSSFYIFLLGSTKKT